MADYISKCRSNYFAVTDEARLREIIQNCRSEGNCLLIQDETDKSKFSIRCTCNFGGLYGPIDGVMECKECKDVVCEECELFEEDSTVAYFFSELQKILPAGEAIIFIEVGSEEMRYLSGLSTIITKDACQQLDLSDLSVTVARNMLCNSEFKTKMDY